MCKLEVIELAQSAATGDVEVKKENDEFYRG